MKKSLIKIILVLTIIAYVNGSGRHELTG